MTVVDMALGALFVLGSLAVALNESRRHTSERELTDRIARMEVEQRWTDAEMGKLAARVDSIEEAARQDPHRKWWHR